MINNATDKIIFVLEDATKEYIEEFANGLSDDDLRNKLIVSGKLRVFNFKKGQLFEVVNSLKAVSEITNKNIDWSKFDGESDKN